MSAQARHRTALVVIAGLATVLATLALAPAGSAYDSERSIGTPEQVAWVRHAAARFVGAELTGDASEACAVLNAPLRATMHGRTCEQRWHTRIATLVREPGMRTQLRAEKRAVASSRVVVAGDVATIELPTALLHGPNRFRWTENCWMLES